MFVVSRVPLEPRQYFFIGGETRVFRMPGSRVEGLVRITEQNRAIPGPAAFLRDIGETRIQRAAITADPMVHLVEPGIERGAGRRARCGLTIMPLEQNPVRCQCIDIGCPHSRMTEDRETVATPLIGGNKQDVPG